MKPLLVACTILLPLACASPRSLASERALRDGRTGASLTIEEVVADLAGFDVVFLGEYHDSDEGHRMQFELTRRLFEARGGLILSMEMFERDVQDTLDAYLAGEIDEAAFLEDSRPWKNYAEHYRPAVELAREHGLPVLAANVPRALAARVVEEGPTGVLDDPHAPRQVNAAAGAYRDRFVDVMGDHAGTLDPTSIGRVFASQCIKDDAMAEAIADALLAAGTDAPPVVHWCGNFHSDFGLGTAERLRWRVPGARVAIVSMRHEGDFAPAEPPRARYVIVVPPGAD